MRFASRTAWDLEHNRFSKALENVMRSGRPLLDLTVSNPTKCGLQYEDARILATLSDPGAVHYQPTAQGLLNARESVADYYAKLARPVKVDAADIFLTTSTSEAYSYAFRLLCDPGDEVLVPRPSYPLFDFLAEIQDVKLVPYPLVYDHGWQVDLHGMESAITAKTRAVIVVHPNNPTGSFVKPQELAELNRICVARDLKIIADEVFLDYSLADATPESFAGNQKVLTFTLSGLSKVCGLPQMKVAWMVLSGPVDMKREAHGRLEVIADTYLSMNAPVQLATPELLETRHQFQAQLKKRLLANLAELDRQLSAQKSCQRLDVEAGWYATLRVPATRTDEELAILLMEEHGVIVHPGHFFDFESDGYLILSLMTPVADFKEGVEKVLRAIG